MITCTEAVRQLWDYLEDEVSAADLGRSAALQLPEDVRVRMDAFLNQMGAGGG